MQPENRKYQYKDKGGAVIEITPSVKSKETTSDEFVAKIKEVLNEFNEDLAQLNDKLTSLYDDLLRDEGIEEFIFRVEKEIEELKNNIAEKKEELKGTRKDLANKYKDFLDIYKESLYNDEDRTQIKLELVRIKNELVFVGIIDVVTEDWGEEEVNTFLSQFEERVEPINIKLNPEEIINKGIEQTYSTLESLKNSLKDELAKGDPDKDELSRLIGEINNMLLILDKTLSGGESSEKFTKDSSNALIRVLKRNIKIAEEYIGLPAGNIEEDNKVEVTVNESLTTLIGVFEEAEALFKLNPDAYLANKDLRSRYRKAAENFDDEVKDTLSDEDRQKVAEVNLDVRRQTLKVDVEKYESDKNIEELRKEAGDIETTKEVGRLVRIKKRVGRFFTGIFQRTNEDVLINPVAEVIKPVYEQVNDDLISLKMEIGLNTKSMKELKDMVNAIQDKIGNEISDNREKKKLQDNLEELKESAGIEADDDSEEDETIKREKFDFFG